MNKCLAHLYNGFGDCPHCLAEKNRKAAKAMKAPTKEQLNDPKWWDENAPEWARSFGLAGIPRNPVFFNLKQYKYLEGNRREVDFGETHTYSLGDIEYVASRPTKQSQEWNGEGLPPVGSTQRDCELVGIHGDVEQFEVVAHRNGAAIVYVPLDDNGGDAFPAIPCDFRPLRTKEQRERDELAVTIWSAIGCVKSDSYKVADAIIAAGWHKADA